MCSRIDHHILKIETMKFFFHVILFLFNMDAFVLGQKEALTKKVPTEEVQTIRVTGACDHASFDMNGDYVLMGTTSSGAN